MLGAAKRRFAEGLPGGHEGGGKRGGEEEDFLYERHRHELGVGLVRGDGRHRRLRRLRLLQWRCCWRRSRGRGCGRRRRRGRGHRRGRGRGIAHVDRRGGRRCCDGWRGRRRGWGRHLRLRRRRCRLGRSPQDVVALEAEESLQLARILEHVTVRIRPLEGARHEGYLTELLRRGRVLLPRGDLPLRDACVALRAACDHRTRQRLLLGARWHVLHATAYGAA